MIRVYELPITKIGGIETIAGSSIIHNGMLTLGKDKGTLVMDTTNQEHNSLVALSISTKDASIKEKTLLDSIEIIIPRKSLSTEIKELKERVLNLEKE